MTNEPVPIVAVVDSGQEGVWVWWTATRASLGQELTRLCGAWRLEAADHAGLKSVVGQEAVLATSAGAQALLAAGVEPSGVVDAEATRQAVIEEIQALTDALEAEQATRPAARRLAPPAWPLVPAVLDLESPHGPRLGWAPGEQRGALAIASWVADLCGCWAKVEVERLKRPVLRTLRGPGARTLPFQLVSPALVGAGSLTQAV